MSLNVTSIVLKGKINRIPLVDATLTKNGWAADAKETGEQIRKISGAGELSTNAIAKAISAENSANEARGIAAAANEVANTAAETANAAQDAINAASTELNAVDAKFGGCWIEFTDEDGNATDEPYIHWMEEVSE